MHKTMTIRRLAVVLSLAGSLALAAGPASAGEFAKYVADSITAMKHGDRQQLPGLVHLVETCPQSVADLKPYLDDADPSIRGNVAAALIHAKTADLIPAFIKCLGDVDFNVRAVGIDALSRYSPAELTAQQKTLLPALYKHAALWDKESYLSVLLVGKVGDRASIGELRKLLVVAKSVKEPEQSTPKPAVQEGVTKPAARPKPADTKYDRRSTMVVEMKESLIKALLKLGDEDAANTVYESLKKDSDPKTIAAGTDAVQYSGSSSWLPALVPLLDDRRDAKVRLFLTGAPTVYATVRDLAADAILAITSIQTSFKPPMISGYSDEQIDEIRDKVVAWIDTHAVR